MKELTLLEATASEKEIRKAISELAPPGPLKIAKLLGVPNLQDTKLENLHEIMDFAPNSEVIEAYNDLQFVKMGRRKVFQNFFTLSSVWLKNIFPFIQKAIVMLEDGKITIEELEDFIKNK